MPNECRTHFPGSPCLAGFQRGNGSSIKPTMTRTAGQRLWRWRIRRADRVFYDARDDAPTGGCSMIEDTLTKAAMSSLMIAAGAVLTGVMTVLLWVAIIELLD